MIGEKGVNLSGG